MISAQEAETAKELAQTIRLLRSWLAVVEDGKAISREEALRYLTHKLHFLVDYLENA
jgi:hypothetical protein